MVAACRLLRLLAVDAESLLLLDALLRMSSAAASQSVWATSWFFDRMSERASGSNWGVGLGWADGVVGPVGGWGWGMVGQSFLLSYSMW